MTDSYVILVTLFLYNAFLLNFIYSSTQVLTNELNYQSTKVSTSSRRPLGRVVLRYYIDPDIIYLTPTTNRGPVCVCVREWYLELLTRRAFLQETIFISSCNGNLHSDTRAGLQLRSSQRVASLKYSAEQLGPQELPGFKYLTGESSSRLHRSHAEMTRGHIKTLKWRLSQLY